MKIRISFIKNSYEIIAEAPQASRLAKNFVLGELSNTSGDKALPMYEINIRSVLLVKMLQELRDLVKEPININSGYRQQAFNKKVGGDANSAHLKGWAVDIQKLKNYTDEDVALLWRRICADNAEIGAINIYDTYYHLEIGSHELFGSTRFDIRDKRS